MRYNEFKINQSIGAVLCQDIRLGNTVLPKGHVITSEDISELKAHEIRSITAAVFEEGDIDYKIALKQIAAQISGEGLGYYVSDDGYCRIVASQDGIFVNDSKRTDKLNRLNENIILNTIAPYSKIKKGDIVAKLEITTPLLAEIDIDKVIFHLSGNTHLLQNKKIEEKKAVLICPHLYNDEEENRYFTSVVMKLITDFDGFGIAFSQELNTRYNQDKITDSLFDAFSSGADLVFVLSPLKSSSRQDVIASAVRHASDDILNYGVPQVGASDLLIAQKGKTKIIAVPDRYEIIDTATINEIIKIGIFNEHLNESMFNYRQSEIIKHAENIDEEEYKKLIMPAKKSTSSQKASIGIVVLAAGQGRRSGYGKLLTKNQQDEPMFMKAVNAAISSDAKPVFVVIGHRHEEMEEYLAKTDVNVLYNPSYASGLKTSLSLGLKSVPTSCDGAILLPADMPNITANEINKLISKFDKSKEKQICMLANKGIKSNPILWSRSLYDKADIVPENAHLRAVFVEHSDYTTIIEIKDNKKLLDVNYANDVKEFSES